MTRAAVASTSHAVLIPSFNTGAILLDTVRQARQAWAPVLVVIDGSDDGSDAMLLQMAANDPHLKVVRLPRNEGKGAAILAGLHFAAAINLTHVLTMDADGQHSADHIKQFMAASIQHPACMVLGVPVFGADAPLLRVRGRKISNWWTRLETGGAVTDSLFGFRVYPIAPLLHIMQRTRWMRRFDFDAEAAVRMCWRGVRPINLAAPVRYPAQAAGGVSHFRYVRDNVLLTGMHIRLVLSGVLFHLPTMLRLYRTSPPC